MEGGFEVKVLGGGLESGRSCVLVRILVPHSRHDDGDDGDDASMTPQPLGSACVMLDCGIVPALVNDVAWEAMGPDFSSLQALHKENQRQTCVSAIIVSHAHVDHIGALLYFVERFDYRGPIYMTQASRNLLPHVLSDMVAQRRNRISEQADPFAAAFSRETLDRVTGELVQTVEFGKVFEALPTHHVFCRLLPSGHLSGAAMVHLYSPHASLLFSGDLNLNPERHIQAADVASLASFTMRVPDLLLCECTNGSTYRESGRQQVELHLQEKVVTALDAGGSVLVAAPAIGRMHELALSFEFMLRDRPDVCIFVSSSLAWESMQSACAGSASPAPLRARAPSSKDRERLLAGITAPCIFIASSSSMYKGFGSAITKLWAPRASTLFVMCGTTLAEVLLDDSRSARGIPAEPMRAQVMQLEMSAHADAAELLQFCLMSSARHIALVHGSESRMRQFAEALTTFLHERSVRVETLANGESIRVPRLMSSADALQEVDISQLGAQSPCTISRVQRVLAEVEKDYYCAFNMIWPRHDRGALIARSHSLEIRWNLVEATQDAASETSTLTAWDADGVHQLLTLRAIQWTEPDQTLAQACLERLL
ncbi:Integrator complex subunit 11 [Porphyridium purpureum]|uniref:Integrator complex subunit 11 n=1 Tax=Porphyridium purpureum TaxID=35688 RepID=A0A5J4YLJ6_PORPP|nr:Integrator complex subunit 11 [Porphyridium purpureum]|eukprot:POR9775..scf291_13